LRIDGYYEGMTLLEEEFLQILTSGFSTSNDYK
jgi:hypothetical protein